MRKISSICNIFLALAIITANTNYCQATTNLQQTDSKSCSAKIHDQPLKKVIREFKNPEPVELKGNPKLFDNLISVSYQNLSPENALKRILSPFNYSIIYDQSGNPTKVYVFDYAFGVNGHSVSRNAPPAYDYGTGAHDSNYRPGIDSKINISNISSMIYTFDSDSFQSSSPESSGEPKAQRKKNYYQNQNTEKTFLIPDKKYVAPRTESNQNATHREIRSNKRIKTIQPH